MRSNARQIADYIVDIFEDSEGNLWFGTMAKGIARYDGETLRYFTTADGLAGNTVVSVTEDQEGTLWFGTHSGLSRYNGNTFSNYTTGQGLIHDRVSNLMFDSPGTLWIGTWGGVCRFDGETFTDFPIPLPPVNDPWYRGTEGWVTEIMEDSRGRIWFGRDGFGAARYDGQTFTHFTKSDGLPSNGVQAIIEDRQGNIWFGCRVLEHDHPDPVKRSGPGGLSRFDGNTMTNFDDLAGLHHNSVYTIYEDNTGVIWIGASGHGVYRNDGTFSLFRETNRMDLTGNFGLQAAHRDRLGTLWLGFSGGLFRIRGDDIVNVTVAGPW
ncbi:MAG: two-component regulator propeller domain-containing protein [Saprospiraceae bacterium]|nr:two-component regulator propeller domain-containing protein [Saprospiraceae bacterium]